MGKTKTGLTSNEVEYEWADGEMPNPAVNRWEQKLARAEEQKELKELMRRTAEDDYAQECLRNIEAGLPFDGHPDTWPE